MSPNIPYRNAGWREGGVASLTADARSLELEWGRRTQRDLSDVCRDAWTFQKDIPETEPGRLRGVDYVSAEGTGQ